MKPFYTALLLLIATSTIFGSSISQADTVIKYGANIPKEHEPIGSSKAIFISDQETIFGPLIRQYEFGGWFDGSGVPGHKSSLLVSPSIGFNVNGGNLFAQALVGPALISSPDTALGGPFQFNNDFSFGVRDPDTKATIGLDYKHVSSAGLELPNRGRDFIMFKISLPW